MKSNHQRSPIKEQPKMALKYLYATYHSKLTETSCTKYSGNKAADRYQLLRNY